MQRPAAVLFVVFTVLSVAFGADQPMMTTPPAPIPTPIVGAKKVFIANNMGDNSSDMQKHGLADATYNQFYDGMQSWGGYELVASPANADLIFSLQFISGIPGGKNTPDVAPEAVLEIFDPATRMPIWTLEEPYPFVKNPDPIIVASLIADIKNLGDRAKVQANNDPNIVAVMMAMNQADIDSANLALTKSKNNNLRAFAQQVIAAHTAIQNSIQQMVPKTNLTPADNAFSGWLKSQSAQVKSKLSSSNGSSFEKYYAADEIQFHQLMLDSIKATLLPNVQNADLKAAITSAQQIVTTQLANAQKLDDIVNAPPPDDGNDF
jgi:putative membrane protein